MAGPAFHRVHAAVTVARRRSKKGRGTGEMLALTLPGALGTTPPPTSQVPADLGSSARCTSRASRHWCETRTGRRHPQKLESLVGHSARGCWPSYLATVGSCQQQQQASLQHHAIAHPQIHALAVRRSTRDGRGVP